ncbi:MAG: hypothetical protein U5N55_08830 [Cypionkella sp.]|nr:hypothetical protein [Cypionkella sp.]
MTGGTCSPAPTSLGFTCNVPAPSTPTNVTFAVTVTIPSGTAGTIQNCVTASLQDAGVITNIQSNTACVQHDVGTVGAKIAQTQCDPGFAFVEGKGCAPPTLTVTKTANGPCVPDAEMRTAMCSFTLTLRNSGGAAYQGPVVVTDVFKGPANVISATASANGLTCSADTSAAHCIGGDVTLGANADLMIDVQTQVALGFEPTTFENCPEVGTAGDTRVHARVA